MSYVVVLTDADENDNAYGPFAEYEQVTGFLRSVRAECRRQAVKPPANQVIELHGVIGGDDLAAVLEAWLAPDSTCKPTAQDHTERALVLVASERRSRAITRLHPGLYRHVSGWLIKRTDDEGPRGGLRLAWELGYPDEHYPLIIDDWTTSPTLKHALARLEGDLARDQRKPIATQRRWSYGC